MQTDSADDHIPSLLLILFVSSFTVFLFVYHFNDIHNMISFAHQMSSSRHQNLTSVGAIVLLLLFLVVITTNNLHAQPESLFTTPFTATIPDDGTTHQLEATVTDDLLVAFDEAALASVHPSQYVVTLCFMTRADFDQPHIMEFINYHLLMGIQHFTIHEHIESLPSAQDNIVIIDEGKALLGMSSLASSLLRFIQSGIVTFFQVRGPFRASQELMQQRCWSNSHLPKRSLWTGTWDVDEFLVLYPAIARSPEQWRTDWKANSWPLHNWLWSRYDQNETMLLLDRISFTGDGQVEELSTDELVIERFDRAIYRDGEEGFYGKPLAFTDHVSFGSTHTILKKEEAQHAKTVTVNHFPLDFSKSSHVKGLQVTEPLVLFHYLSRSHAECLRKLDNAVKNSASSWRGEAGAEYCAMITHSVGKDRPETVLKESVLPSLIRGLRNRHQSR